MAFAAEFIFLVVIPIWTIATLITKWIEGWASVSEDELIDEIVGASGELSKRVAALEGVIVRETQ